METPTVLLFFANDNTDYLQDLIEESRLVEQALADLDDSGAIKVFRSQSTTTDDITIAVNRYQNRGIIFHFAGHAGNTMLKLEDQKGDSTGLARLLGLFPKLKLVFLNGCSTKGQVEQLLKEGVPAIIATSVSINDKTATQFANHFYKNLASSGTIKGAFKYAAAAVEFKEGFANPIIEGIALNRGSGKRDIQFDNIDELTNELPWGLYYDESNSEVLDYKLPSEIPFASPLSAVPSEVINSKEQKIKKGHVQYNIPEKMQLEKDTRCIVKLAFDEALLFEELEVEKNAQFRTIKLSDSMKVELIDPTNSNVFEIRSTSELEQFIADDDLTEWRFYVKPLQPGEHILEIKVSIMQLIDGKQRVREKVLEESVSITAEPVKTEQVGNFKPDPDLVTYLLPIPFLATIDTKEENSPKDSKEGNSSKETPADSSATNSGQISLLTSTGMKWVMLLILALLTGFLLDKIFKNSKNENTPKNEIKETPPKKKLGDTTTFRKKLVLIDTLSGLFHERKIQSRDTLIITKIKIKTSTLNYTYEVINQDTNFIPKDSIVSQDTSLIPIDSSWSNFVPPIPTPPTPPKPEDSVDKEVNTFTDARDRHEYSYMKFGNRFWMTRNLNFKTENSKYYDNKESTEYGRLYTWKEAAEACPKDEGWRLPNDEDWKSLFTNINGGYRDNGVEKPNGNSIISYKELTKNDSTSFSAKLGGAWSNKLGIIPGTFDNLGTSGYYWSATDEDEDKAFNYYFDNTKKEVIRISFNKQDQFSCRCVKNIE